MARWNAVAHDTLTPACGELYLWGRHPFQRVKQYATAINGVRNIRPDGRAGNRWGECSAAQHRVHVTV